MQRIKAAFLTVLVLAILLTPGYQVYGLKAWATMRATAPVNNLPEQAVSSPAEETGEEAAEYQEPDEIPEVIEPVDAPLPTGKVYLTIDDGPDIATTPAILEILDHYQIKATFFVIGTQVEKFPDLVSEIYSRGHYIGNHTYSHIYKEIYASKEAFLDSLKKNDDLIFSLTGVRPRHVRDPGGLFHKYRHIKKYVESQGFIVMGWNVDSYDSRVPVPDSATIVRNVLQQTQKEHLWSGMTILVHESRFRKNTVEALPEIIESLLAKGFTFHIPEDN